MERPTIEGIASTIIEVAIIIAILPIMLGFAIAEGFKVAWRARK